MRTLLLAVFVVAGFLPEQSEPINTMCPVKPRQKARATITGIYEGQVIGFC